MELCAAELVRASEKNSFPISDSQVRWNLRVKAWAGYAGHLTELLETWETASSLDQAAAPTACHLMLFLALEWHLAPMNSAKEENNPTDARAALIRLSSMGAQWERWPDLNRVMQGEVKLDPALHAWAVSAHCQHGSQGAVRLDEAVLAFENMLGAPLGMEPEFWSQGEAFRLRRPILSDFYGAAICRRMKTAQRELSVECLKVILKTHAESARCEARALTPVNMSRVRSKDSSVLDFFSAEMHKAFNLCGGRPDLQDMLNKLGNQFDTHGLVGGKQKPQAFWMLWAEHLDLAAQSLPASPASRSDKRKVRL